MNLNVRSRVRKLAVAAAVMAATASIVGGATPLTPAPEASADILTNQYFQLVPTVTCDSTRNTARVTVSAAAQPAYYGMAVQVRLYVSNGRTANWTNWSASTRLYTNYTQLVDVTSQVGDGTDMRVYAELRYWTVSGWSTPQGAWANRYQVEYGYLWSGHLSYGWCFT